MLKSLLNKLFNNKTNNYIDYRFGKHNPADTSLRRCIKELIEKRKLNFKE